jgi:hypothetical protein
MRLGSKDPAAGYGYLFAGEAELVLGHPQVTGCCAPTAIFPARHLSMPG